MWKSIIISLVEEVLGPKGGNISELYLREGVCKVTIWLRKTRCGPYYVTILYVGHENCVYYLSL